jgi:hypothetical protein
MPIVSLSTWSLLLRGDCLTAMRFAAAQGFSGVEIWSSALDLPPWGGSSSLSRFLFSHPGGVWSGRAWLRRVFGTR